MSPSIETFGLWTNKGGVGKTTLTFHLATLYAHLHPEKCVLLVDMCPQANLSHTALTYGTERGSAVVRELQKGSSVTMRNLDLPPMPGGVPRTVAGYLHSVLGRDLLSSLDGPKISDFIVRVADANARCPSNVYLLCGDGRMDVMPIRLREAMNISDDMLDGFKATMSKLRYMVAALRNHKDGPLHNKDIAVFIDTNPAFTEYTQLALCSMDKLIVPVNADDFSLQAVEHMFNRVWGLFDEPDQIRHARRSEVFAFKAAERAADLLPKLAVVVHNRHTVRVTRAARAFQHLHEATADRLYAAFQAAGQQDGSNRVFAHKGHPDRRQFEALYAGTMREMFSTGVAAAHTGIPLHGVLDHKSVIRTAFHGGVVIQLESVIPLVTDMVKLLSMLLDDHDMGGLSPAGTHNLYHILRVPDGDRATLKKQLKWTARKRAYEHSMAAAQNREPAEVSDGEDDQDYVDPEQPANGNAAAANGAAAAAAAAAPAASVAGPANGGGVPTPARPAAGNKRARAARN